MSKNTRPFIALSLFAALGLSIAGCSSGSAEPAGVSGTSAELTKVTVVTNWLPSAQHAPLYLGVEEGIFEAHGLDVSIEAGKGSTDAAQKVGAGTAQFGLIDTTASLVASAQGADIVNVATWLKDYPGGICYNADKVQISSIEDFDQATIGTIENDAYTLGLKALMTRAGMNPQEQLHEEIIDAASQQSSLLAERVEMIPCATQSKLAAIRGGEDAGIDVRFFSLAENGLNPIGFSVIAENALVAEDEEVVKAFVAAFMEATDRVVEDPEAAVNALKALVPDVTVETELDLLTEEVIPLIGTGADRFEFSSEGIEETALNARDSFGIEVEDPASVFTNAFVSAQ